VFFGSISSGITCLVYNSQKGILPRKKAELTTLRAPRPVDRNESETGMSGLDYCTLRSPLSTGN
jgi:hypothetical protein